MARDGRRRMPGVRNAASGPRCRTSRSPVPEGGCVRRAPRVRGARIPCVPGPSGASFRCATRSRPGASPRGPRSSSAASRPPSGCSEAFRSGPAHPRYWSKDRISIPFPPFRCSNVARAIGRGPRARHEWIHGESPYGCGDASGWGNWIPCDGFPMGDRVFGGDCDPHWNLSGQGECTTPHTPCATRKMTMQTNADSERSPAVAGKGKLRFQREVGRPALRISNRISFHPPPLPGIGKESNASIPVAKDALRGSWLRDSGSDRNARGRRPREGRGRRPAGIFRFGPGDRARGR